MDKDYPVAITLQQLTDLIDTYNRLLPLLDNVARLENHILRLEQAYCDLSVAVSRDYDKMRQIDTYVKQHATDFGSLSSLR